MRGGGRPNVCFALFRISQALSHVANAGLGTAMLYELIEVSGVLAWETARAVSLKGGNGPRILNMSGVINLVLV